MSGSELTGASEPSVRIRPGARVLVVNARDEILLIHEHYAGMVLPDQPEIHDFHVLPGGGIEPGDSPETAALRELWEETGIVSASLGPCIWLRDRVVNIRGERVCKSERIYLLRVDDPAVSFDQLTEDERAVVRGYRWWSLVDLRTTSKYLSPPELPTLAAPILAGVIPENPIRIV